jgi:hypothetical protein
LVLQDALSATPPLSTVAPVLPAISIVPALPAVSVAPALRAASISVSSQRRESAFKLIDQHDDVEDEEEDELQEEEEDISMKVSALPAVSNHRLIVLIFSEFL